MKHMKRVIILVMDGVGAGAMPDAYLYGDGGANTLQHVLQSQWPELPNLSSMGLGQAANVREYMVLVGIACLIGIPLAIWAAQNYLESYIYRLENYWWIFALAGYAGIVYVMFGGARRLELRQNRNYGKDPEYQAYVKKTPILLPFIPLYSVANVTWLKG